MFSKVQKSIGKMAYHSQKVKKMSKRDTQKKPPFQVFFYWWSSLLGSYGAKLIFAKKTSVTCFVTFAALDCHRLANEQNCASRKKKMTFSHLFHW